MADDYLQHKHDAEKPFVTFLQDYQKKYPDCDFKTLIKTAGNVWSTMKKSKKARYQNLIKRAGNDIGFLEGKRCKKKGGKKQNRCCKPCCKARRRGKKKCRVGVKNNKSGTCIRLSTITLQSMESNDGAAPSRCSEDSRCLFL